MIIRSGIQFDPVLNVKEDSDLERYCFSTEILSDDKSINWNMSALMYGPKIEIGRPSFSDNLFVRVSLIRQRRKGKSPSMTFLSQQF